MTVVRSVLVTARYALEEPPNGEEGARVEGLGDKLACKFEVPGAPLSKVALGPAPHELDRVELGVELGQEEVL